MRIPFFHVDTFTGEVFSGNPAAVCPLEEWLDDSLLQAIARESFLPATAFFVPQGEGYHIRWFTPAAEEDLCGHATLAAASVVFDHFGRGAMEVVFFSGSGELAVTRREGLLCMDFPSQPPSACDAPAHLLEGLRTKPEEVLASVDYLAVLASESDVRRLNPDMDHLRQLDLRAVIVTARGSEVDFVSRFFEPKIGLDEDPVTGAAHCALAPYWAERLKKTSLSARQLSRRGGELHCEVRGDRVLLSGRAVEFMQGTISI